MEPKEREAAERRIQEIKGRIKAVLDSNEPLNEGVRAEWTELLTESLQLQEKLDLSE